MAAVAGGEPSVARRDGVTSSAQERSTRVARGRFLVLDCAAYTRGESMSHDTDRARRRALFALLAAGGGLAGALRLALAQTTAEGMRQVRGEVTVDGKPARV